MSKPHGPSCVCSACGQWALGEVECLNGQLRREGYRRCDIAACNCGEWHGGHAADRLRELSDELCDGSSGTILDKVVALKADVERLREMVPDREPGDD